MRISMAKEAFNRKISLLTSKLNTELRCYVWSIALYGSETWTLRQFEQRYLKSFEMWCWRRMEKKTWPQKVTNEQVFEHTGEKCTLINNILHRKANWNGHTLRINCLLHDIIEGQMTEVKGVGRRRTQLLDDLINAHLHLFRSSSSSFSPQHLLFLKSSRNCVLLILLPPTPFTSVICPSMIS